MYRISRFTKLTTTSSYYITNVSITWMQCFSACGAHHIPGAKPTTSQTKAERKMITKVLKEIPLKEVQLHDTVDNIWIVLFNRVYDITSFLHEHPGGYEVLLEYAGRDASLAFLGAGHESVPMSSLESYLVGILPKSEHLNLPFPDWNNRLKEFQ